MATQLWQWCELTCSCMRIAHFENWCAGKGGANTYRVGSLRSHRVHSSLYGRGWRGCFQWQCRGLGWAFWSSLLIMCTLLQDLSVALTAGAHGVNQILKHTARFRICKFNAWWAFWAIILLCGSGSIGVVQTAHLVQPPIWHCISSQSPLRHQIAVANLLCDLCYRPSTDPSVTTFSVADRSNPPNPGILWIHLEGCSAERHSEDFQVDCLEQLFLSLW